MKPLIGLTVTEDTQNDCYRLHLDYCRLIRRFGGIPVLLPPVSAQDIPSQAAPLSGILLTGGGDLHPALLGVLPSPSWGETNLALDRHALFLARFTLKNNIPVLGICRGMQVLAAAAGGTLASDIAEVFSSPLCHVQKSSRKETCHPVFLRPHTKLHSIIGRNSFWVNSFHHQAVLSCGSCFRAAAYAPDGVLEALEKKTGFALGVHWHPERMAGRLETRQLLAAFFTAARRYDPFSGKKATPHH